MEYEVALLAAALIVLLFVLAWVFGRLSEARRESRGFQGESLLRLEALQQWQERCRELEGDDDQ